MTRSTISPVAIGVAVLFAALVLAQGISAPFQKDAEPQSAEWIQSIVRDGHWLIPQDAYGFIDRKPPLFYWMSASAAIATGRVVDETRARVVSLAAGVALAAAVLAWTWANVGPVEGALAFLFLLGTYGFASRATTALTDMLLTALLFAAYCVLYGQIEARGSTRRASLAGAILGLGVLTKGPVAIVLSALAVLICLLLVRGRPLAMLREWWPWMVAAIAIAIGAIWYVPAAIFGKEKFLKILFAENFGHFMPQKLGGTGEGIGRPFYFIAARILGGAFPMALLLIPATLAMFTGEIAPEKRRAILYQVSMTLAVLIFFSLASVKRDDYILPAMPGIAILCASLFALEPARESWTTRLRNWIVATVAIVMAVGVIAAKVVANGEISLPFKLHSSDAAFMSIFFDGFANLRPAFVIFEIAVAIFAALACYTVYKRRVAWSGVAVGALSLAGCLLFTMQLRPGLASRRSLGQFARLVHTRIGAAPLCIAEPINYELSYYYGAAIPSIAGDKCPVPAAGKPVYLFASPREMATLGRERRERLKEIEKSDLIGGGGPPSLYEVMPAEAK